MALQDSEGDRGDDGRADRGAMLADHHRKVLWIPWTLVLLGVRRLATADEVTVP